MAADGMRDWFRVLEKRLEPHLASSGTPPISVRALLSTLARRTFERRWDALCAAPRSGLRGRAQVALGGPARNAAEAVRARMLLASLDVRARWEEVATHLGELLSPPDPPQVAMEILRMSEYVFRVKPEHWGASNGTSCWLEGTACPWYTRPGWNGAHCGIDTVQLRRSKASA
jgi:hypothetical protein